MPDRVLEDELEANPSKVALGSFGGTRSDRNIVQEKLRASLICTTSFIYKFGVMYYEIDQAILKWSKDH